MHKCELTNEQLQAEILLWKRIAENKSAFAGPNTRQNAAQLADALQELIDRRDEDGPTEFRLTEAMLAYDASASLIDGCVMLAETDDDGDWYDLANFAEVSRRYLLDAIAYLNQRGLLDRHPDHPAWIAVRDEDEPRADGPLDPAPEVK